MQNDRLSKTIVGMILLPVLGNDATPIRAAVIDRMDIALT